MLKNYYGVPFQAYTSDIWCDCADGDAHFHKRENSKMFFYTKWLSCVC